jgi:hypothetical protein
MNLMVPLLHRPTFDKGIADGYHRRNSGFGATVLLVCAIGSRYSTDPRVFIPEANSDHTAGWKWFDQVQAGRKPRLAPPSLYDLQKCCVSSRSRLSQSVTILTIWAVGCPIFARIICSSSMLDNGRCWYSYGPRCGRSQTKNVHLNDRWR